MQQPSWGVGEGSGQQPQGPIKCTATLFWGRDDILVALMKVLYFFSNVSYYCPFLEFISNKPKVHTNPVITLIYILSSE